MKKLIMYLSCLLMITLLSTPFTSCSNDSGEPGKIELAKGESSKVKLAANTSSSEIKLCAAASWSAYASAKSNSQVDVDWIHLNSTEGLAGEVSISFSLDRNDSGKNRTAYIIILCEDEKLVISVTQTTEIDEDEDDDVWAPCANQKVEIEVKSYYDNYGQGYKPDGITTYLLRYEGHRPVEMVANWRDDLDPDPNDPANHDSYCLSEETTSFDYENGSVSVNIKNVVTYYPSQETEIESSQHYAEIKDGRVVKGWYKWDEDANKSSWEATYDNAGRLASTKNNDGTSTWDTYTYSWKNGCIEKIVWTDDKRVVFTYADPNLENLHRTFDLNWLLPTELECYDFAAGDITRMFAITGLMGEPSSLLLTAITEYTSDNHTRSYRMNYKGNASGGTEVTVMEFADDVQVSYSEWTIYYGNIN